MPTWKRIALISAAFGVGFAVAISIIGGLTIWYQDRPRPWNDRAITGTFGGLEVDTQPSGASYKVVFQFNLQNNTTDITNSMRAIWSQWVS